MLWYSQDFVAISWCSFNSSSSSIHFLISLHGSYGCCVMHRTGIQKWSHKFFKDEDNLPLRSLQTSCPPLPSSLSFHQIHSCEQTYLFTVLNYAQCEVVGEHKATLQGFKSMSVLRIKRCIYQRLCREYFVQMASKTLLGLLYDNPNKISEVKCVLRQSQYWKCAIIGGMITNNNLHWGHGQEHENRLV